MHIICKRLNAAVVLAVSSAAVLFNPAAARAADAAAQLVSQPLIERHGLTRAWFAQIPVGGRTKITHITQDEGTLFVQTSDAMLYALDTETGRLIWSQQVGEPSRPTQKIGSNGKANAEASEQALLDRVLEKTDTSDRAISQRHDKVIAVANGSTLYLLNRADGSIFLDPKNNVPWKLQLRSVPEAAPLVTDDMIFVPTAGGLIEVYMITDSRRSSAMLSSTGRNHEPPVQVGDRIAWATDKGILQITQPKNVTIRHRIETTGPITTSLVPNPPLVYAGSVDGFVYCINETTGDIVWKLTTGSPVRDTPVLVKGAIFVTSEEGGMFRADALSGHQAWFNPAPKHLLAVSPTKVYALDSLSRLLIINAKSGATVDRLEMPEMIEPVLNDETDRIFLKTEAGLIQCLHEIGAEQPQNYELPKIVEKKPAEDAAAKPAKPATPKAADDGDKPKPPVTPKAPKEKSPTTDTPTPPMKPAAAAKKGAKADMP